MLRIHCASVSRPLRNQVMGPTRRMGTSANNAANPGFVLGVIRESYNAWERRAPLCPRHVKSLMEKYQKASPSPAPQLSKIIVQPSNSRIFSDAHYREAGAVVQEDLSEANLILGVKRPTNEQDLLPHKAYSFFSHVIKGQPENMTLLQYALDNDIQLFDYECIVKGGLQSTSQSFEHKQERLVAFGKFAGRAGVNDALHALGRRLLHRGYSTPFLHVPLTYIYSDWCEAKRTLRLVGDQIRKEGLAMEPLVFCITGRGGKVHGGAMEVMHELPHKLVTLEDLPSVVARKGPHRYIYVLQVGACDLFVHKNGESFERSRYQAHPDEYYSIFADRIAPYTSVLVNTAYWNERFPRLLPREEIDSLYKSEASPPLQVVADISCDINGSIEFLDRTTSIEQPFYEYDPHLGLEIANGITGEGITVLGIDILPSELPKESSEFFGDTLLPFINIIIQNGMRRASDKAGDLGSLPIEIRNACITVNGHLTEGFKYLNALVSRHPYRVEQQKCSMIIGLKGHLFDSGMVNQVLDIIERYECRYEVVDCTVRQSEDGCPRRSLVVLKIAAMELETLNVIHKKVGMLSDVLDAADATVKRYNTAPGRKHSLAYVESDKSERVLVLGSGSVSNTAVEYLGRRAGRHIIVGGDNETQVRKVARYATKGSHVVVDIASNPVQLESLIDEADLVVSLLPAAYHGVVAEMCINHGTNLVTASYESDAMRARNDRAMSAGVTILNEVGLDPGLDHMSAMKIIDDIKGRGGRVWSFESHCGGLPAPSAADNPLRYKFSWNPKGVLTACLNSARYLVDGHVVEIDGEHLLASTIQDYHSSWSDLDLECLPNRDSLVYMEKYGIESANTCFRGTLRYAGFSAMMNVYRSLGFFYDGPLAFETWGEVYGSLCGTNISGNDNDTMLFAAAGGNPHLAQKVVECNRFLGIDESHRLANPESVMDSFAKVLEKKLSFESGESDMVLMHHKIVGLFDDGSTELHSSLLQLYGDEHSSAMSKTVGYTTAIAAEMLLNGEIPSGQGLLFPTQQDIYNPILNRIREENIIFSDHRVHVDSAMINL